jgi:ribosomal protein S18 acetylase RimI-like enzyme
VTAEAAPAVTIVLHEGPREPLRFLFELADDSSSEIDTYVELGRVLVAVNDHGHVVGHLQLVPVSHDGAELKSLAVREDYQGRGVGSELVRRALAMCREEGLGTVTVTTASADIDNLRFYQRRGFRPTSVAQDAFGAARGYPPMLEANGIPVRDSITFAIRL